MPALSERRLRTSQDQTEADISLVSSSHSSLLDLGRITSRWTLTTLLPKFHCNKTSLLASYNSYWALKTPCTILFDQNSCHPQLSQMSIRRSNCDGPWLLARLLRLLDAWCDESLWIAGPAEAFPNLPRQGRRRPTRKAPVDLCEPDHDGRMRMSLPWMYLFLLPTREGCRWLLPVSPCELRKEFPRPDSPQQANSITFIRHKGHRFFTHNHFCFCFSKHFECTHFYTWRPRVSHPQSMAPSSSNIV